MNAMLLSLQVAADDVGSVECSYKGMKNDLQPVPRNYDLYHCYSSRLVCSYCVNNQVDMHDRRMVITDH